MGGLANIIADSSYNGPNVGYSLPVSRGARTVLFPKVDGPTSIANKVDALAGGVGNGQIVGGPGFAAGYASFATAQSYVTTGSSDSATTTIMAVARSSQAMTTGTTQGIIGSNFTLGVSGMELRFDDNGTKKFSMRQVTTVSGNPTNSSPLQVQYGGGFTASISGNVMMVIGSPVGAILAGDTVYNGGTSLGTVAAFGTGGTTGTGGAGTYQLSASNAVASTALTAIGHWAFVAASFAAGGNMTIYNKTLGQMSLPVAVPTPHIAGAGNYKMGGAFSSTSGGQCDIAFWAEHNVELTSVEIDVIYLAVKAKLAAYAAPIAI
jgi:hypothetical protein